MLDAVRHRVGQNVQTQHVAAAPRLTKEHHAAAPPCIIAEQCQKPCPDKKIPYPSLPKLPPTKILTPLILFAVNVFDGVINGIKSLINWKETASAKINSRQARKHGYFH